MRIAIAIVGCIAWVVSGVVLTAVVARLIEVPSWVFVILLVGEGAGLAAFAWFVAEGAPPDSSERR